ncbi:MAG: glycosyltransferase family 2 protein [Candidatus Cloacimonetes bacterium]|nr:glycosyltransferase family 2 protein [Candidatus Cloacimonadota bacterium]
MQADYDNTAIIIPVYNCDPYLRKLIEEVSVFIPMRSIFIINDGSTDNSERICLETGANLISFPDNRGKGAALRAGFAQALGEGFIFAITIDGDRQHEPSLVPDLITTQQKTGAQMVIGRRRFSLNDMPLPRILSNAITSFLVSMLVGSRIYDSQSGYRLYDLRVYRQLQLTADKYQFETEIILKYGRRQGRFAFVPMATIYNGQISYISHFRDIGNFLRIIWKEMKERMNQ